MEVSTTDIQIAQVVYGIVKKYALSVLMVINAKKSDTQLNVETPLPESLRETPRMDGTTYTGSHDLGTLQN